MIVHGFGITVDELFGGKDNNSNHTAQCAGTRAWIGIAVGAEPFEQLDYTFPANSSGSTRACAWDNDQMQPSFLCSNQGCISAVGRASH